MCVVFGGVYVWGGGFGIIEQTQNVQLAFKTCAKKKRGVTTGCAESPAVVA